MPSPSGDSGALGAYASNVGLHPSDPERLIVIRGGPRFLRRLFGLALLLAGAACEVAVAEELLRSSDVSVAALVGAFVLMLLGGILVFGRTHAVVDRRAKLLRLDRYLWLFRLWRSEQPLEDFERVLIERKSGQHRRTFTVALADLGGKESRRVVLDEARSWEQAVPVAEALAHFLRLPIWDAEHQVLREFKELDIPIAQHAESAVPAEPRPPDESRVRTREDRDGTLRVTIPCPGREANGCLVGVGVLVLLWALPLWFADGGRVELRLVGIVPLAVAFLLWIKMAWGYSAELAVTPGSFRVRNRYLLWAQAVEFPAAELEEILLHDMEAGPCLAAGCSNLLLVARSDRGAVRFGYGLSKEELEWLRRLIIQKLASTDAGATRHGRRQLREKASRRPPFEIPTLKWPSLAWIGFAAGATAGNLLGGPLGVCAAAPFLEWFLNVGSLIGLFAGAFLDRGLLPPRSRWTTSVLLLLLFVCALYWLFDPARALPVIRVMPSFDEANLLRVTEKPWAFWAGWFPVAVICSVAALGLALWILAQPVRLFHRSARKESKP